MTSPNPITKSDTVSQPAAVDPRSAKPRVLDVGNCGPDHAAISRMLKQQFDADTVQADTASEALERLARERFDLILVNRKLDHDYSDGMDVIRLLRSRPELADVPVMLVTNYAEYQDQAVELGALRGFGKLELAAPATRERLSAAFAK